MPCDWDSCMPAANAVPTENQRFPMLCGPTTDRATR
jgi:hypothetical protein